MLKEYITKNGNNYVRVNKVKAKNAYNNNRGVLIYPHKTNPKSPWFAGASEYKKK